VKWSDAVDKEEDDEKKFWPKVFHRRPEGALSPSERRSKKLMKSLYEMRRISPDIPEPASPLQQEGAKKVVDPEEQDEALLHSTLRDISDTEAQLRVLEEQMAQCQEDVADCRATRHATAVISARTLAVVRRKAALLHDVEERTVRFERAHAGRAELLPRLIAGEVQEAPADFKGVPKFLAAYTHHPGNPADANKSDFEGFAASFRLPSGHEALERLRGLADEAGEWWAEACVSEASKGADHIQLVRLFDLATGTGVDRDHPKLVRATRILNDRLAERVLKEAEELRTKDAFRAERSPVPQVGPASTDADKIDADILKAIAEGVPSLDRRLAQARDIAKALRQLDGQRKREAGRQKRLAAGAAGRGAPAVAA